ncbi:TIGR02234 family membrane protein [Streptomyces lonarensis]|uniref:TIGR02234 family membrane protein n=1 Tax=Streptomyces lonarensis TaxID=700599 RepID=A0A7X6D259_9ACTN|nr:TIGR02234 family membrane protein [Streptomyces lonarensis]NJQ06724.1 TIGR02234 family membrane protein [Streptomyces lonarensis]
MNSEPGTRDTRAPRRALALTLASGAAGAAVVLVSSGQTWAEGSAAAAGGTLAVDASGNAVSGLPSALALVGLAALVAVFAVRRTGRRVVSAVLALSGAGATATALVGAADTAALESAAAEATGLTQVAVTGVSHTAWPWVCAVGGLLLLTAGVVALAYGGRWPAMSGRYERSGPRRERRGREGESGTGGGAAGREERPEEMWKALDRGEDPT